MTFIRCVGKLGGGGFAFDVRLNMVQRGLAPLFRPVSSGVQL